MVTKPLTTFSSDRAEHRVPLSSHRPLNSLGKWWDFRLGIASGGELQVRCKRGAFTWLAWHAPASTTSVASRGRIMATENKKMKDPAEAALSAVEQA